MNQVRRVVVAQDRVCGHRASIGQACQRCAFNAELDGASRLRNGVVDWPVREHLLAMQDADQRLRGQALEATGEAATAIWAAVSEADRRHTARLREIVAEHGWPGRTLVGDDGAHAAWLLAQHADHDPGFQRECLTLLAAAVRAGEAAAVDYAYLADRVAVAMGRAQTYGTQHEWRNGAFLPIAIDDLENVDARRHAAGLGPLAENTAAINAAHHRALPGEDETTPA